MIEAGSPEALGSRSDGAGVNFAVYSACAERVSLCLFDRQDHEIARMDLPGYTDGVWHGYVKGLAPGTCYGFRVHGPYAPELGQRCNPHKLLLDPYARSIDGALRWNPALFGDEPAAGDRPARMNRADSAPFVPKAVVSRPGPEPRRLNPVPWSETVVYELNVRGYTKQHPALAEADRGTFRGLKNRQVLEYIKALGVTTIELLPVHAYVDEQFLVERGLRNYWGYNTLGFFAPEPRFLGGDEAGIMVEMVNAMHDLNLEVVLDVVYNHTAEGNEHGPTLSLRGFDNAGYYRLRPDNPALYVNDTGCGNTLDFDRPQVRRLVLDSLRYWASDIGVDGFRFDLATILGRSAEGFSTEHVMFRDIASDPVLSRCKLIAEPWDIGPGGYRLGGFPGGWAEWNDRYRDAVRRFWRGDYGLAAEFARRVHGSADIFEASGRGPCASINFIASHDGFTTADLVSYEERHNEANGEENRDGHIHNFSQNFGVEGPTEDPSIQALRRRQRLNLLASLLWSQGVPMLLAGDEFGNSQQGNNNAYAQDNSSGWLNWQSVEADPDFCRQVRELLALRRAVPLLRQSRFLHGLERGVDGGPDIEWIRADGQPLSEDEWEAAQVLGMVLRSTERGELTRAESMAAALLFNAGSEEVQFHLPELGAGGKWRCAFTTGERDGGQSPQPWFALPPLSCACCLFEPADSPPTREIQPLSGGSPLA